MVDSCGEGFQAAVARINDPANKVESTNDDKLALYGWFKQATVGDINIAQPWAVQVEARAKWEAWNKVKGFG